MKGTKKKLGTGGSMATSGVNAKNDRLLLIAPHGPANFGVVVAPELGDFVEGEVVTFTDTEGVQDGGNGRFVFVSPAKCKKVTDPGLVETYRSIIYGGC